MPQNNAVSQIKRAILSYPKHDYNYENYDFQRLYCNIRHKTFLDMFQFVGVSVGKRIPNNRSIFEFRSDLAHVKQQKPT